MQRNKLLNLLAANRRRGEFKAEASQAGNTIYLYDAIVASEAEAQWFGGVAADSFVKALRGMTGDVSLRINCPGGDVFAAAVDGGEQQLQQLLAPARRDVRHHAQVQQRAIAPAPPP